MKDRVELALLVISATWVLKLSLLSMVMPKYFAAFVGWRGVSCISSPTQAKAFFCFVLFHISHNQS